jgi:D-aminoacyl-tRNA deacylase
MRALIQRVSEASVTIEDRKETRSIGRGLVVLLCVAPADTEKDAALLAEKIAHLRLFHTRWVFEKNKSQHKSIFKQAIAPGKDFDLALTDFGGDVLIVPQYTLFADVSKGNRPDFTAAAKPEPALPLYESFVEALRGRLVTPAADPRPVVATGVFGGHMRVSIVNEGPLTLLLDTADFKKK